MPYLTPELHHVEDLVNTRSKTPVPYHVGLCGGLLIRYMVLHLPRLLFFLFGFLWIILLELLISYKLLKSSPEWFQIQIQTPEP